MGKDYSLSLVFIGNEKSRELNYSYRGKNEPTNILSFPLDKKNGEIFITLDVVQNQTKLFDRKFKNLVAFLFIHGLLHLQGYKHGKKMEKLEKFYCKKFKLN